MVSVTAYADVLSAAVKRAAAQVVDSDDDEGDWDVGADEFDETEDFFVEEGATMTDADEAAFNAFMHRGSAAPRLLSDIIAAKIQERGRAAAAAAAAGGEAGMEEGAEGEGDARPSGVDEQMEAVYTDVGKLLSRCARPSLLGTTFCHICFCHVCFTWNTLTLLL